MEDFIPSWDKPGKGYRLVRVGEMIKTGDEYYFCGGWQKCELVGITQTEKDLPRRRKVRAKQ